jgi:hypothetical protein
MKNRLLDEQQKIQSAVSEIVPEYELEYMREHPAFKEIQLPIHYIQKLKEHPIFHDAENLFGQIIYKIS